MERNNRTWLCSILFLDIVGYSKLFLDTQMKSKQNFSNLVTQSLKDLSTNDLIILDTGDGLAVSYLGDPEDMLFVAVGLRDAFRDMDGKIEESYQVRLGINLGPVKIMEDINGNKNTVGDGINVAQRIMDFAGPNQLLVSQSYYDVVSCLNDTYQKTFKYLGRRADKHVRKHAVYEVVPQGEQQDSEMEVDAHAEIEEKPSVPTAESSNVSSVQLDENTLHEISISLAGYVGPMAKIIISRQAKKSSSLTELVKAVSEEITSNEDKQSFLNHQSHIL